MNHTTFEEVFSRFRSRIRNYDFLEFDDFTILQYQYSLLIQSIFDFSDICKTDIENYDSELMVFNQKLTGKEINILSLGMMVHFLEPYVYNTDALQNAISTKDFSVYSPANLLEKMTELLKETKKELKKEINLYSFKNGEISDLSV